MIFKPITILVAILALTSSGVDAKKTASLPMEYIGTWYTVTPSNLESDSGGEMLDDDLAKKLCKELVKDHKHTHSYEGVVSVTARDIVFWDGVTKLTNIDVKNGAISASWASGENNGLMILQIRRSNSKKTLEITTVFGSGGAIVDKYDRRCD